MRNVLAQAHVAHARNDAFCLVHRLQQIGVGICRSLVDRRIHDALAIFALIDVLPQLFGDEWHEWVEQAEQTVEETERSVHSGAVDRLLVGRLHCFEIPSREFFPEQAVDSHQGFVEAEF